MHVDCIHSDQSDAARAAAIANFRSGATWVLIATDLLGRGMDFPGVNTVVNYDCPSSTTEYVHRVGRTGRAGRHGARAGWDRGRWGGSWNAPGFTPFWRS